MDTLVDLSAMPGPKGSASRGLFRTPDRCPGRFVTRSMTWLWTPPTSKTAKILSLRSATKWARGFSPTPELLDTTARSLLEVMEAMLVMVMERGRLMPSPKLMPMLMLPMDLTATPAAPSAMPEPKGSASRDPSRTLARCPGLSATPSTTLSWTPPMSRSASRGQCRTQDRCQGNTAGRWQLPTMEVMLMVDLVDLVATVASEVMDMGDTEMFH